MLTPPEKKSKYAQRNEGVISLIVEKVRSELLKAVCTESFYGAVTVNAAIVNQDVSDYDVNTKQQFKTK